MTANRLEAVTAPMAKLEYPSLLSVKAINGGWKPKINPTPKQLENTAANPKRSEAGRTPGVRFSRLQFSISTAVL